MINKINMPNVTLMKEEKMSNIFNKRNAMMTLYICEFTVAFKSEWAKFLLPIQYLSLTIPLEL